MVRYMLSMFAANSKRKTVHSLLFLLFFSLQFLFADTIVLNNGTSINGRIVFSHPQVVRIRVDTGNVDISKAEIHAITFSSADIVRLNSGMNIECKILSVQDDSVRLFDSGGVHRYASGEIQGIEYNLGHPLTVTEMPVTGPEFTSSGFMSIVAGDFQPNFYIGVSAFLLQQTNNNWDNDPGVYGTTKYPIDLLYGVGIGYTINRNYSLAIQYEFFDNDQYTFVRNNSSAWYGYYYGSFTAGIPVTSNRRFTLFAGLDAGMLRATVEEKLQGGETIEKQKTIVAPRINAGFEGYMISENISLSLSLGYLFADAGSDLIGQPGLNAADVNFSGYTLATTLRYHFPSIHL